MTTLFSIGLAAAGLAAVLGDGFGAAAWADGAVSGINGKVSGLYGSVDGEDATAAEGSISVPLGNRFGFQADGLVGEIGSESIHGIGVHLFWRNPRLALLGITGAWTGSADLEVNRAGLEGEYYLDQFTFAATVGQQSGDINDAVYGGVEARFYPIGNLMLAAAWSRADEKNRFGAGAEYQTPLSCLSVFAQLAIGNDDYEHVFGGLRFYIGEQKTLGRRHREDDPPSMLLQSLTANWRVAQASGMAPVMAAAPVTATAPPATSPSPAAAPATGTAPPPATTSPPTPSIDGEGGGQEMVNPGGSTGEDDKKTIEEEEKKKDEKDGKGPKDK
jgi:hypothetical protein